MKVLILKPRLDIPFKSREANPPKSDKPLPAIRQHWDNFVEKKRTEHLAAGDEVILIEKPFLQITKEDVESIGADRAYVPHHQQNTFNGDSTCLYYMQTVFPWLFTIDKLGWGGGASFVDEDPSKKDFDFGNVFTTFQKRIEEGESKYIHDTIEYEHDGKPFIFCPLQIPHDKTIELHSNVRVEELAISLAEWSVNHDVNIIFKHHPANDSALLNIEREVKDFKRVKFLSANVNIHSILKHADACYTINSGVGLEAMLHEIPVVRFGDAEYNNASIKGDINNLTETWNQMNAGKNPGMVVKYMRFYDWYINHICYDTRIEEEHSGSDHVQQPSI